MRGKTSGPTKLFNIMLEWGVGMCEAFSLAFLINLESVISGFNKLEMKKGDHVEIQTDVNTDIFVLKFFN